MNVVFKDGSKAPILYQVQAMPPFVGGEFSGFAIGVKMRRSDLRVWCESAGLDGNAGGVEWALDAVPHLGDEAEYENAFLNLVVIVKSGQFVRIETSFPDPENPVAIPLVTCVV